MMFVGDFHRHCGVASGSATAGETMEDVWKRSFWDHSSLPNPLWDTIRRQIAREDQSSKAGLLILASNEVSAAFTLRGGYF